MPPAASTPPPPPFDPASAHSPSLELETQWSGDHDGETIARPPGERAASGAEGSGAPARPAPGPVATTPPGAPGAGQLLAVLCSSGHANPPQRPTCRVCGVALGAAPTRVPRPALGTVIAVSGESLPLTGPVVIGRAPQAARFTGTEAPRLMKLPHPHISSSHVALRIEDWNVLAVDLGSTNGTFLRRNGRPPFRLSDTSHLLVPGDVLDLGHGVHLRFEELP
nr:FHA domain-containing protein [Nocardioides daedukensis]